MKELNLIAAVGKTGYGVAGFNILKTLSERDWDICLFPRGVVKDRSKIDTQLINFTINNGTFFKYDSPCINIWHQYDLSTVVGRGTYIGWPIFELDTFDERERHNLNYPDKLIVCSEWAKQVCIENDITPEIHVVPLGIDQSIFNDRTVTEKESDNTIFLNVGKWEIRKGHDILIDAFEKAFNVKDNVELWMMPFNYFLSAGDAENWENMYLDTEMGRAGKVKIVSWQQDHRKVAQIMSMADCGVFPSRAEGWNLELLEMMALGKPVIATDYSAHTQFCDKYNCMLIDIDKNELAYDGKWFFDQGNWAALLDNQLEQLVDYMKLTHQKCQRPGRFINDAGLETAKEFTWDNTSDLLEKILLDTS